MKKRLILLFALLFFGILSLSYSSAYYVYYKDQSSPTADKWYNYVKTGYSGYAPDYSYTVYYKPFKHRYYNYDRFDNDYSYNYYNYKPNHRFRDGFYNGCRKFFW